MSARWNASSASERRVRRRRTPAAARWRPAARRSSRRRRAMLAHARSPRAAARPGTARAARASPAAPRGTRRPASRCSSPWRSSAVSVSAAASGETPARPATSAGVAVPASPSRRRTAGVNVLTLTTPHLGSPAGYRRGRCAPTSTPTTTRPSCPRSWRRSPPSTRATRPPTAADAVTARVEALLRERVRRAGARVPRPQRHRRQRRRAARDAAAVAGRGVRGERAPQRGRGRRAGARRRRSSCCRSPTPDGKLTPELVAAWIVRIGDEHAIQPGRRLGHAVDRARHALHAGGAARARRPRARATGCGCTSTARGWPTRPPRSTSRCGRSRPTSAPTRSPSAARRRG